MARGELLDIMALYAYDHTLFNNFTVPTTITWTENTVDGPVAHTETIPYTKDNIIDNICLDCAELEVVYPDADYMKLAIGVWSMKRLYTWQRIADVLYRKYDPFLNIQRNEWRTTIEDRDLAGTNDVTGTNNVNAYDDSTATGVQRGQVVTDQDTTDTGTITTTDLYHVEGDSAIRDRQDIIRLETQERLAKDLIDIIIDDFKKRFCLQVY